MAEVTLGKTGITVNKNGFGALPIQRIPGGAVQGGGHGIHCHEGIIRRSYQ